MKLISVVELSRQLQVNCKNKSNTSYQCHRNKLVINELPNKHQDLCSIHVAPLPNARWMQNILCGLGANPLGYNHKEKCCGQLKYLRSCRYGQASYCFTNLFHLYLWVMVPFLLQFNSFSDCYLPCNLQLFIQSEAMPSNIPKRWERGVSYMTFCVKGKNSFF